MTFYTQMETTAIVGILAGASVIHSLLNSVSKDGVKPCVSAYYADKFNGDRHGSPSKTFLKCMKTNYPETFKEMRTRYKPAAAAVDQ